jgi:conjugal transfer pilus assembly protein TraK
MRVLICFSCLMVMMITVAHAVQIQTVNNYDDISVKVSITEPNSVMLTGDRIQQMKAPGNTLIDACNGKQNCKLIDEVTGVFTFMPSPLYQTRTFTINLMTENGFFYNLLINPKPIPSQTIVLKPYANGLNNALPMQTSEYEKSMVDFLHALVNGHLPNGFKQTKPPQKILKAKRTQLKPLLVISGKHITGEIFELSNLTNQPIIVDEKWFNWSGTKAIALDRIQLAAFEKTRMYRIS